MRSNRLLKSWPLKDNPLTSNYSKKIFLRFCKRKWGYFFLFAVIGLFGGFLYLNWKGQLYTSKATFELLENPLGLVNPSQGKRFNVSANEARTYLYKIQSYALAESVAKTIFLDHRIAQKATHVLIDNWKYKRLNPNLPTVLYENVIATYREGVITVEFTCPDPELTSVITDHYARQFLLLQSGSLSSVLENELAALKSDEERFTLFINLQKDKLTHLAKTYPDLNLGGVRDEATKLQYLDAIVEREKEVAELEAKLTQVLPLINDYEKLRFIDYIFVFPPVKSALARELVLNSRLQNASLVYGPKHPKLLEAKNMLEQNDLELKNAFKESIASLEVSWRKAKTNLEVAKDRLKKYNEKLIISRRVEQEYENASQEFDRNRRKLSEIQSKIEQIKIFHEKGFSSIKILSLSEGIVEQVTPNIFLISILGIAFGLVCCFGVLSLLFRVQSKFVLDDETHFDNIPILASLPKFSLPFTLLLSGGKMQEILNKNYFDKLSATLFANKEKSLHRTLLVVSSIPGEGKSFVACNLAINCASRGERILIIEMDFRNSKLGGVFGLGNCLGLKHFLFDNSKIDQIIHRTNFDNLFLLPSGGNSNVAFQKLNSIFLESFLSNLSKDYDRVIIDTPPLSLYGDANFIIPHCDSVIVVAGEDRVSTAGLSSLLGKLEHFDVNVVGIVANFVFSAEKHVTQRLHDSYDN